MKTTLLTFTAYHAQTNDSSKRTNQTIKIVLRFIITNFLNFDFVLILPILQIMFNNLFNVFINLFFNEIFYGFKIRDTLSITLSNDEKLSTNNDFSAQQLEYRRKATNVIVFVNAKVKIYYNARHMPLLLNSKDYVYLRLHYDYQLLSKLNKKLSQQRCESFLIKRRIKKFAYELNLSSA